MSMIQRTYFFRNTQESYVSFIYSVYIEESNLSYTGVYPNRAHSITFGGKVVLLDKETTTTKSEAIRVTE